MLWRRTVWLAVAVVLGGGLAMQAWSDASPQMRQLHVNGVELAYLEQGTGVPVIFVHGAPSDLRYWEPQRQAVATQYRFIAVNFRYHGTAPWADEGQHYSVATHAADLAAFLRQLNVGPVHLVAISYGGFPATLVALDHPDLVRSLIVLEPALGALLADIPEAKPVRDEWGKAFAPIRTAAQAGDVRQAATLLFDLVNNQGPGTFEKQPEAVRQITLDNARTIPLLVSAPRPPVVSCALLGTVKAPSLVVGGEHTARYFALINEVVVRCIPGSRLVIIPQATHPMSRQNPAAFNETLLQFLAQH